jgi:hypothetical protein
MQISALRKVFNQFNPAVPADEVDFSAYVDSTLTVGENRSALADAYPEYTWYKVRPETRGAFD